MLYSLAIWSCGDPINSNRILFQYLVLRYGANTPVKPHRRDFVYSFRAVAVGFPLVLFFCFWRLSSKQMRMSGSVCTRRLKIQRGGDRVWERKIRIRKMYIRVGERAVSNKIVGMVRKTKNRIQILWYQLHNTVKIMEVGCIDFLEQSTSFWDTRIYCRNTACWVLTCNSNLVVLPPILSVYRISSRSTLN